MLGAIIHMMVGAMYGAVFALIAHYLRWRGAPLVGAGMVWGLAVFAVSTWIGLPLAAALFGGGDPIRDGQRGRIPDVHHRTRAVWCDTQVAASRSGTQPTVITLEGSSRE